MSATGETQSSEDAAAVSGGQLILPGSSHQPSQEPQYAAQGMLAPSSLVLARMPFSHSMDGKR